MTYVADDPYSPAIAKPTTMRMTNRNMKFGENPMRSEPIANNTVAMIMAGLRPNLSPTPPRISPPSHRVMKAADTNAALCTRVRPKAALISGSAKVMSTKS